MMAISRNTRKEIKKMEKTMEKQGAAVHERTKLLVMTGLFIALGYVAPW